jgi:membrane-associated phospholipid phosphatase
MIVANAVSMTSAAGVAVPLGMWLWTKQMGYAWLAVAVVVTAFVVEWIKRVVVAAGAGSWSRRPAGATDCDNFCVGGPVGGAPGFPSGHMTTATLLVTGLWFLSQSPVVLWIGIPWIGAMAWARWVKRCHNLVQIVGGIVTGFAVAVGSKSVGLL